VLILIPYQIRIGFAIERLIKAFYEMALRLTGDPAKVHFGFTKVGEGRSSALPTGFTNLVEFDPVEPSASDVRRLASYVEAHGITSVLALDLPVEASFLRDLRRAGVSRAMAYWGAPISSANSGLKLLAKRVEVSLRRSKPDLFIFESEAMQTLAVRGRGIARPATAVVHLGVDVAVFRPNPDLHDVVYARFDIPRDRHIVVFMGHLHERKGVQVLMRAAGHVARVLRRDDLHFLFLGNRDGEADQFRDAYAGATEWITFGGYQSDVPALLAGCFLGCIPSTGWDSFTMSSIEMQACGLPVVVSDLHGLPETVANGETGLAVRAGDHVLLAETIASLADDPGRRAAMGIAARRRIETRFTRQHQIDNLVREVGAALDRSP
jgi:glycosyltransferase involved in cell wall biosynthesis